jgi:hypothetical protein
VCGCGVLVAEMLSLREIARGVVVIVELVRVRRVWVVFLETRVATRREWKMERATSCGGTHSAKLARYSEQGRTRGNHPNY